MSIDLNNINNKENEEDWEIIPEDEQNEETKEKYIRLNIEGASKLKFDFSQFKNYHTKKLKMLEKKEIESFYDLEQHIKEKYIPNIEINHEYNNNPYISILNNDYLIKKNPEIGTCLIYEIDDKNQELNLIGKSSTWYETTVIKPKLSLKKTNNIITNKKSNKKIIKSLNLKKIKIGKEKNISMNNSKSILKKKRKRKKKRKYHKDTTIIEIKRIFESKDNIKEQKVEKESKEMINNGNKDYQTKNGEY